MNPLIPPEDKVWCHPKNNNKNDHFLSPDLGTHLSHIVNPLAYKLTRYMVAMGCIKKIKSLLIGSNSIEKIF